MKYISRLIRLCFVLLMLFQPIPTWAASSSSVTGVEGVYERANLSGQDLSGQTFITAEFPNARLIETNLSKADLRGAVFNGTDLSKANLSGADITNGLSYLSNFNGANLTDAILAETIMLRTTFKEADITGADFSLAVLDGEEVANLCKRASGVNPKTGIETKVSLNCK